VCVFGLSKVELLVLHSLQGRVVD